MPISEVSKLSMPHQLQWQKQKLEYDREQKAKEQPPQVELFDPNADPTKMTLPEQLKWMKKKNAYDRD